MYTADAARKYPPSLRGTVAQCKEECDKDPVCLGFSREGGKSETESGYCYLKQNIINKSSKLLYSQDNTFLKN